MVSNQLPFSSGPTLLLQPEERRKRIEAVSVARVSSPAVETNEARRNAEKAAGALAAESYSDRQKRLAARRASDARSRAAENNEQRQKRLDILKASKAKSRATETSDRRQKRLEILAASRAKMRGTETSEQREKRLETLKASRTKSRAAETSEQRKKRLNILAASRARMRAAETSEQREKRLDILKVSRARSRATESSEKRQKRLDSARVSIARSRRKSRGRRWCGPAVAMSNAFHTDATAEVDMSNQRSLEHIRRTELSLRSFLKLGVADVDLFDEKIYPPPLINHVLPSLHTAGAVCVHCKAMRWLRSVRVSAAPMARLLCLQIPHHQSLLQLYTLTQNFCRIFDRYNNALSLASLGMGQEIIRPGFSPVVTLQGKLYHLIGTLLPINNSVPEFAQIYFVDNSNEVKNRLRSNPDLRPNTLTSLQTCLRSVNPYITSFKAAIELQTANTDVQLIIDAKRRPTGEHARCFNLPTGSEVAVIMPGGHADKLDIILHSRQGSLKQISTMHRSPTILYTTFFCFPSAPMDITLISGQVRRKG